MLSEDIKRFVEAIQVAFVASADVGGCPHLAAGMEMKVLDADHLAFENWFCRTTLRNVSGNPQVSVVVVDPETGSGFQFAGQVVHARDTAILDGFLPDAEPAGTPQTLTSFVVRVEEVTEFSAGAHTDLPLERRLVADCGSSRIEEVRSSSVRLGDR